MGYDVIVSGAGPAGSSAAYHLAEGGASVLLIDRCTFPREKVCGEGITPRATRDLYSLGLRERLDGNFNKLHGLRIGGPGKEIFEHRFAPVPGFPDHGYTIPRMELDAILLNLARDAGATVAEDSRVSGPLIEDGRVAGVRLAGVNGDSEITSRVVIGADGAHSTLGRAMNLLVNDPTYLAVAIRQYFEGAEDVGDFIEFFLEKDISPGMGWILPITDSLVNVGFGGSLSEIRSGKIDLKLLYDMFLHECPHASRKLKNARPVSPVRGGLIRWGLGGSRVECPGLILVGEAAGVASPLSGEGISFAIETGEMAAEHVLENGCATSESYCDGITGSFRRKLARRYGWTFDQTRRGFKLVNRPWLLQPGFEVLKHAGPLRDYCMKTIFFLKD